MPESHPPSPILPITPIGVIRTKMRTKFDSPHQPKNSREERNVVQLHRHMGFEVALRDLAKFDRIWLVWWFHKNTSWRPLVLPPRGDATRRGVFATRSPHRPNPIGITAVPLLEVDGLNIFVGNTDLVDGTPILDVKPYIATVDAFPDSSLGWLVDVEAQLSKPAEYQVCCGETAIAQVEYLRATWGIDFIERVTEILERNPTIHRTRRIRRWREELLQIGCGAWRAIFSVDQKSVFIHWISPGYPDTLLVKEGDYQIPDREAQVAFKALWPDPDRHPKAPLQG